MSPTSTMWYGWRRPTPSGPAIDWQPPDSCSAAPPAPWSCGALDWLSLHGSHDLTAVAIAPDFGERYLDTVYHTNWVQDLYGEDVLSSDELITASKSA